MLKAFSKTSFYLDGELIDTNMIEYDNRMHTGNHKKLQAVCKLKLLAHALSSGSQFNEEKSVREWLKEAK